MGKSAGVIFSRLKKTSKMLIYSFNIPNFYNIKNKAKRTTKKYYSKALINLNWQTLGSGRIYLNCHSNKDKVNEQRQSYNSKYTCKKSDFRKSRTLYVMVVLIPIQLKLLFWSPFKLAHRFLYASNIPA